GNRALLWAFCGDLGIWVRTPIRLVPDPDSVGPGPRFGRLSAPTRSALGPDSIRPPVPLDPSRDHLGGGEELRERRAPPTTSPVRYPRSRMAHAEKRGAHERRMRCPSA